MERKVFSVEGKETKTIQLSDDVFACKPSEGAIYHAIRNELSNARVGTASKKTRSEVIGSRRKPWRQKGTGRARSGTRQSPIWVGGGMAFAVKPRDYRYSIPKKMKRAAMKSILSLKAQDDSLKIIEDFKVESGKTKDLLTILKKLVPEEKTVMVLNNEDVGLTRRAGNNIPWLRFLSFSNLRAHDLFYGKHVLMTESAALKLNDFYTAGGQDKTE